MSQTELEKLRERYQDILTQLEKVQVNFEMKENQDLQTALMQLQVMNDIDPAKHSLLKDGRLNTEKLNNGILTGVFYPLKDVAARTYALVDTAENESDLKEVDLMLTALKKQLKERVNHIHYLSSAPVMG